MIRRRALRHAYCLFALALAATITRGRALADEDASTPVPQDDEVRKLDAYRAELVEEIETLRGALARSEKVRQETKVLLESASKRLREQRDAKRKGLGRETQRREKELSSTRQALDAARADEARQTARAAELEKAIADLHAIVATQDAEHKKLEGEVAALEHARNDAARSQAALVASREQQTKQLAKHLAEAEHERERRAGELEAQQKLLAGTRRELEELRAARDRNAVKTSGLDREVQTLRAATTEQAAANQRLQADLARLTREGDDQAKKNAEALASRNEQVAQLSRQLADAEREATERATRLEAEAQDLAATRSTLESLKAEQRRQSDRARSLDGEVATLRAGAVEQAAAKQRLEEELSRSAREGKEQAKQHSATIAARDADVERLQRGLATADRARQERDAKIAAQEEELVSARGVLETLQTAQRERSAEAGLKPDAQQQGAKDQTSRPYIDELTGSAEALATHLSRDRAERDRQRGDARPLGDDSQGRIAALEVELRKVRDRELTSRDETKDLEQALEAEKQTSRSKLEALQSVLQSTRTAGAELRASLDDARRKNADLSRQVGDLNEAVRKVHALRTKYEEKELEALKTTPAQSAGREVHGEKQTRQSSIATDPGSGPSKLLPSDVQTTSAPPAAEPAVAQTLLVAEADPAAADLREQLSVERERRETLEQEIQRLTASGNREERFVEVWEALQSARSEILVLSNQLSDERKSRENLEVTLARIQGESGGEARGGNDVAQRLAETLNQRRAEADRLGEQLKNANEIIVRLKGRLEGTGASVAENKILGDLDKENESLRDSLKAAQEANASLRVKAEMAERLAEMVYGKSP
jgi:chromosome segregation ATPase